MAHPREYQVIDRDDQLSEREDRAALRERDLWRYARQSFSRELWNEWLSCAVPGHFATPGLTLWIGDREVDIRACSQRRAEKY